MRYRRADGGWTHLNVHYRAGDLTPSGKYEMYGLSQSVTSLAKARDEATANAQRLRLALKAAGAGVFEYDYPNRRMWLSPEVAAMLNAEARRSGVTDPFSVFHPDDRQRAAALRGRAVAAGQVDPIDLRMLHADGERWVRVCFEVDHDAEGLATRGVGVILDIHERKLQELALDEARRTAEAATATKSGFLASVSHEIRTPMNGIVGVLNLLKRERLTAEGADLLEEALGCSEMLSQLINDVLDFSKIEAGRLELAPSPTDPLAVTQGVVNLLTNQAEAKGLFLRLVAPETPGWVLVDSLRLRQCLFNVIGNAVKFTERGGVEVRLALSGAGRKQTLTVEVEDTGIGVAESAREQLFDRFHQADTGATRKFGGTGLGLAISRVLARMMGGDMDYESLEGRGSTFWFTIDAPAAASPVDGAAASLVGAPLEGLRVLLVDDNRINRLVAAKSLEALGAETEEAESGPEAIEAVSRSGFDLVLMDINMPGMDGLEATRHIRALGPGAAGIPIVALTADVMSHHRQAYFDAGMNGVVPKPFSPAQLLAEITRLAQGEDERAGAQWA
jgi:signal transduction histidine kinase/CheY-like chemotaxis protein